MDLIQPVDRNDSRLFRVPAETTVTNGESEFESRVFTDGYEADYISVQRVERKYALSEDS